MTNTSVVEVRAPASLETPPSHTADSAIATAADLADRFAEESALRDRERILPVAEVDALSASGLLAITVPVEYGGPGLGAAVLAEVVRLLATADPSVAQIPHSHFVYVNALVEQGTEAQKRLLLGEVVAGRRFGNAQSEINSSHVRDHATTLRPDPASPGGWVLDGEKGYATGALLAHWIPVLAHLGEGGALSVAWVERHADGVTVIDDWDGLGQRTTASGSVRLQGVRVAADRVTPYHLTFERPQVHGAFAQLLHAGIDAGIARAAVRDAAAFVTTRSRPHPDALALYDTAGAAGDPLVVQAFGEIELQVRAAEALLAEAGRAVDRARADLTATTAAAASLAVAAARASTTAASLEASSRLFEVGGTRSALASLGLDRHWRNARTHTLHDPAAWKVHHLGRHAIDGTLPPAHGQI
ncbi:SfnB family sulfur acquisition oxidoreductase [Nocardioides caeni]|uniref:Dibenzothiophene monooxygenase n=1 Tax=Nocardioides caeni TaxID=574700 RepID=A0A4S8NB17_9ACTN|nr:SfnB family sulfur acquisition oxidoreductase [Nocardioides caeni]THV12124.1 SfnB family sulfur acquisition oxidoreductase [Nocardioides caeni]